MKYIFVKDDISDAYNDDGSPFHTEREYYFKHSIKSYQCYIFESCLQEYLYDSNTNPPDTLGYFREFKDGDDVKYRPSDTFIDGMRNTFNPNPPQSADYIAQELCNIQPMPPEIMAAWYKLAINSRK